jgi:hypothetical protein
MDPGELSRDTSGARAYAAFLTELGDLVPAVVLPHVSLLMGLLDGEVGVVMMRLIALRLCAGLHSGCALRFVFFESQSLTFIP